MSDMSLDEAMELLGISNDVTEPELKRTFRRLSRNAHPDLPSGNEARQKKLNLANEIVREALFGKRAIVPKQIREPLQRLERTVAAEQAMRQAEQFSRKAKARSLKRVTDLKWITLGMAGLSGAIGWLADSGDTPLAAFIADGSPLSTLLKPMAFAFGAMAAVLQFITNARSQAIDTYTDELDDKQYCAAELAAALRYQNRTIITSADLRELQESPPNDLLPRSLLGYFPKRGILILKAVGHGLLEEIASEEIGPNIDIKYRIKFQPIRFGTAAVPSEPDNPKPSVPASVMEAGTTLAMSALLASGLFWLTRYLLSGGHTGWGWFAGFWAVLFGIATFVFAFDLAGAVKRRWRQNPEGSTGESAAN